jgi:hypothetical protein
MARWELSVERDGETLRATYGWDPHVGFFVTAWRGRRRVREYDVFDERYDNLKGQMAVFIEAGVFSEDDLAEALRLAPAVEDVGDIEEEGVRVAIMVLERVKGAAGA